MVLPASEQEEGAAAGAADVSEVGESGMVGFDGSGEPGIRIYVVICDCDTGSGEIWDRGVTT